MEIFRFVRSESRGSQTLKCLSVNRLLLPSHAEFYDPTIKLYLDILDSEMPTMPFLRPTVYSIKWVNLVWRGWRSRPHLFPLSLPFMGILARWMDNVSVLVTTSVRLLPSCKGAAIKGHRFMTAPLRFIKPFNRSLQATETVFDPLHFEMHTEHSCWRPNLH